MATGREIRRAIVQARYTQGMSQLLLAEFAFIGVLVWVTQESGQAGLITFIALWVGLFIPVVAMLIVVVLGGFWALGSIIMAYQAFGIIGGIVIGGFGAMIAFGLHIGAVMGSYDARF